MYYIIDTKKGKILSFGPKGPIHGLHDSSELGWVEEAYNCCYLDTYYDAEVVIKLLVQYGGFKNNDLEVRKMIHD